MCPGTDPTRAQGKVAVLGTPQDSCQCLCPPAGAWSVGVGRVCQAQLFSEWNQRSEEPGPPAWHLGAHAGSHGQAGIAGHSAGGPLSVSCWLRELGGALAFSKPSLVEMRGRESHLVLVHPAPCSESTPLLEGMQCVSLSFSLLHVFTDVLYATIPSPEPWRGFGASVRLRCSGDETLKCFVYFLY